jgi:DNA-binding MarR family transcriptional regulator
MASTRKVRWLDERESRLWRGWLRVNQELAEELGGQLSRDGGLSSADYAVLVPLSESPEGVLRARDLRQAILWARDRLSHHVRRMEKRGLVAREESPDDARGTMIRLTPTGRAAIEKAAPQHVDATRKYFIDLLSDEEIDMLTKVCDRILANLAEPGRPPTSDSGAPPMPPRRLSRGRRQR